mgnify:CR=1 FL=1
MKEPPRQAEMPGKDKITVPVQKAPSLEQQVAKNEPSPVEQLNIPAKSLASAQESLPGAIEAPAGPPTLSQGSGTGGGAGTGTGSGVGPEHGFGPGPRNRWRHRRRRRIAPATGSRSRACCAKCVPTTPRTPCGPKCRASSSSNAWSVPTAPSATCR